MKKLIHKTMSLKERQKLGFAGYLDRALCAPYKYRYSIYTSKYCDFLSFFWKKVTCSKCKSLLRMSRTK